MTDKAKELIDKFMDYSAYELNVNNNFSNVDTAKQCVLIAVDEVIKSLQEHQWQNRHVIDEYEQIKKELYEGI